MTPARLAAALATLRPLGITLGHVLKAVGYASHNTGRQWLAGAGTIPEPVGAWIERIAAFHEANPPPQR